ncbi:MAG: hypothetical protein SFU56_20780 [Capsulimonadales bacterium]|nr:hypothetical protein [Capsulimonadales bacterium]
MNECDVPPEMLAQYQDGALPETERARIALHLAQGCVRCQTHLAWLAGTVRAIQQATQFVRPPERVVRKASRLFRERRPSPSLRDVLARLVFDSRMGAPALAGVRDAGSGGFQRLYSTERFDIDLWGEQTEARAFYLIGQVRSRAEGAAVEPDAVTLTPAEPGVEPLFALPDGGEFHVPDLPPGVYTVRLLLADEGIVLSDVRVGD